MIINLAERTVVKKDNSKKFNANIFTNFPEHHDSVSEKVINNEIENKLNQTINSTHKTKIEIEFRFKNESITQQFADSKSKNKKKENSKSQKNNNDVFLIQTSNEIENNRHKNPIKNHEHVQKKNKQDNLTNSVNKTLDFKSNLTLKPDKSLNQTSKYSSNDLQILTKDSTNKIDLRNVTYNQSKILKVSESKLNEKQFNHSIYLKINESNSSLIIENKNFTFEDYLESNSDLSDSLTNKINSFFVNYGNGYNNIDIPFSNFDFSKALPQEFLNQINKTSFDYDYLYKRKTNDYPFINEIGSEKFNSLYEDITQDSDFNNFITEEYKNIHFDKPKTEEVKISNQTKSILINKKNHSKLLKVIKTNFTTEENNTNILNFSLTIRSKEVKNQSNELQNPIVISKDSLRKVNISAQSPVVEKIELDLNKTKVELKFNRKNHPKTSEILKSLDNDIYLHNKSYSNNSINATNFNSQIDHSINLTSKCITNTFHFNKYKEDLKKINDLELIIKSNTTSIDNKDILFKKIQISKELKLKSFNKTQNISSSKNSSSSFKANREFNMNNESKNFLLNLKLS